jgi:N-methylhydantoinase A
MPSVRIEVDVGGTFTDLCSCDKQTGTIAAVKVPSTLDNPSQGILAVTSYFSPTTWPAY